MDPEQQKNLEINQKIITLIDSLLATGDWESSLFLRTAKKHFMALREQAQQLIEELSGSKLKAQKAHAAELKEGYIKVYISLYQTIGPSIQIWQNVLKALAKYSVTRPVYANEDYIREMIRSRPDADKHAYAVVAIKGTDVIKLGKPLADQFGHELLTLKEGAVQLDNILEFIHANKKHYFFHDNTLIPKDAVK